MAIVQIGYGNYTTTLPAGAVTPSSFNGVPLAPKVATDFAHPIPTNDWSSSLVFPRFSDQYSSPMFAHPLAMKADASGFNLGYSASPDIFYYNDNPQNQFQFRYTYHNDLHISLDGMNANSTLLEDTSAYFNKALWLDSDSNNQLHATFGHGSPFVYFERTGNAGVVVNLKSESTGNSIGQPDSMTNEVFKIEHVNGTYNGGQLGMDLLVNALAGEGSAVGNAVEARISIDTNGDGKFDFIKTMNFFPLDPATEQYEHYLASEAGRSSGESTIGQLQNLNDATIKVDVWKSFGSGDVTVQTGASNITLPFNNVTVSGNAIGNQLFLSGGDVSHTLTPTQPVIAVATLGAAGSSVIPWDGAGEIWYYDHNVIGITINDNHYGLFAPTGSEWHVENGVITSDLSGKDYFSAALLPDNSIATLQYFEDHAYAFVTDSHVDFSYDADSSKVITTFTVDTDLKEPGHSSEALTGLLPHQWLNSDDALTDYTYQSARGEMKLLEGNSFQTASSYNGLLPQLPNFLEDAQKTQLYNLIDAEFNQMKSLQDPIGPIDSYWSPKLMARIAELAELSDQVGHQAAKEFFINTIRLELEDWFTADPSDSKDQQFYYNAQWDILQPYPGAYGSDDQMNDHHFHAGYFVRAAYTVEKFLPGWADNWGDMMNLFIKSVANSDAMDTMFPFLRNFDPYEGHSWASGDGSFFSGNNQESSSEALNFASSLTLWGAITQNAQLENLGQYLFSTELSAVQQYWFDINNINFPDGFDHNEAGIVWSDGATYSTWFSASPEKIQGINYLPITATSLYLGLYPEYVAQNFAEIAQWNNGPADEWTDIIREYQALYDPAGALNGFTFNYTPEEGESYAHTYSWLNNLNVLGHVERSITADSPFYGVFNKDGLITYVAYNPGDTALTVTFSDGKVLSLDPHETLAVNANREWSNITGSVVYVASEEPPVQPPAPQPEPEVPQPEPVAPEEQSQPEPVTPPPPAPQPTSGDIMGTNVGETIIGTANNDVIDGLGGDDVIHAAQGNDTVYGGDGSDRIYGNFGNNTIIGGSGADFMNGGMEGNNVYKYLALSDSTTNSTDTIEQFKHGKDKLDLSALNINPANVRLAVVNDLATLTVDGSDFSIKFIAMNGGAIALSDMVFNPDAVAAPQPEPEEPQPESPAPEEQSQPEPVVLEEQPQPAPQPSSGDIMGTNAGETIIGTANNDVIYGLGGDDTIHAGQGSDTIYGGDGNDHIFGNFGDNLIIGGAGADFMNGGMEGNNVYKYLALSDSTTNSMDTIEQFKHGKDKLDLSALNINADNVHISTVNDLATLTVDGSDFSIKFIAMTNGGIAQSDIIFNADAEAVPQPAPEPQPVEPEPAPAPAPSETSTVNSVGVRVEGNNIYGTNNNDTIHAADDQGYNIYGAYGNDTMIGGAGNDRIYGIDGNNTIIGGGGADFMNGGTGHNTYKYASLSDSTLLQKDTIESFHHGKDTLDLTMFHVNQADIHIATVNDSSTVTIANTDFAIHFIASDPITHDDIQV